MTLRPELSFLGPPGEVADWRMVLLYDVAAGAGVFEVLPGTPAEVASARGLDEHAVRVVLEALAVWRIVERDASGRYAAGAAAPDPDLGPLFRHHARSLRLWTTGLEDRLHGVAPGEVVSPASSAVDGWMAALAAYARPGAGSVIDACLARFPHARTVLDLGGGHGEHALAFAARGLQVTMQDRTPMIDLARRWGRLESAGIELFEADFFEALPDAAFDLVFSSAVSETYDRRRNEELHSRLRAATCAGGGIALLVFMRGRNEVSPVFAVQMLGVGLGGDTHGESDYRGWLEGAGFAEVEVVDVAGTSQSLVLASRREDALPGSQ